MAAVSIAASATRGEGESLTKEDLFYYIYGLLHSPDYRSRYADNLGKELPRIPAVKTFGDFRAFSKAGRELAHWQCAIVRSGDVQYEQVYFCVLNATEKPNLFSLLFTLTIAT